MLQTVSIADGSAARTKQPRARGAGTERKGDGTQSSSNSHLASELHELSREMLFNVRGWPIVWLAAAIAVVLIGNMVGQVRLNVWNGAFFDAVQNRNADAFFW